MGACGHYLRIHLLLGRQPVLHFTTGMSERSIVSRFRNQRPPPIGVDGRYPGRLAGLGLCGVVGVPGRTRLRGTLSELGHFSRHRETPTLR
jgi:hypothetical protein